MKLTDAQFKQNLESITYGDVIKLRETKAKHALKLEELEISLKLADEYVEVIKDFLDDMNFNSDRIESFECRRRDGFIPYSHNNGGLEGVSYTDQYSACENTGFDKVDAALTKYYEYDLESFLHDKGLAKDHELTEEQLEVFDEYRRESDDTIQYRARIMMTSETTANVDFYVSVSDSPYHRQSDDKLELSISFKSPKGMKRKLNALLKNSFIERFSNNVKDTY